MDAYQGGMMNEKPLEELLRNLVDEAPIRVGTIPDNMYTYMNDPRMPIFTTKPDYFVEVNFD